MTQDELNAMTRDELAAWALAAWNKGNDAGEGFLWPTVTELPCVLEADNASEVSVYERTDGSLVAASADGWVVGPIWEWE